MVTKVFEGTHKVAEQTVVRKNGQLLVQDAQLFHGRSLEELQRYAQHPAFHLFFGRELLPNPSGDV